MNVFIIEFPKREESHSEPERPSKRIYQKEEVVMCRDLDRSTDWLLGRIVATKETGFDDNEDEVFEYRIDYKMGGGTYRRWFLETDIMPHESDYPRGSAQLLGDSARQLEGCPFRIGERVEIYSRSYGKWFKAKCLSIDGDRVLIQYEVNGNVYEKKVNGLDSAVIRKEGTGMLDDSIDNSALPTPVSSSGLVRQRTMSRNVSNSKQGRNYLYQPEMEAKDFSLTPKLPLVLGESPEENDVLEENNKQRSASRQSSSSVHRTPQRNSPGFGPSSFESRTTYDSVLHGEKVVE